ncbi:MAG: matrixin family metalloprotease [Candidatus Pacebacteria bacterium]|nr:matrixin family metalloprotease [Candidatus Paceibacterota bacterium]MCF7863087.1 matrixin family metalloprotease [Candidatus Paceibacterota bacterium]
MFTFLKSIIYIAILIVVFFLFQQPLQNLWRDINIKYLPCINPIKYSIGRFDDQFGLSQEDFLRAVISAEEIWEKPINKNLFEYDPNGNLKINLIYNVRQEATSTLQEIGIAVGDDKSSYEELKSKYEFLKIEYNKTREALEKRISVFETRQKKYEDEVASWNAKGEIEEETYNNLNKEKTYLEKEVSGIKKDQSNLNKKAEEVNALVVVINRLVGELNIQVEKLNTIGKELGEFEEGTYIKGPEGERIDIYQFDNKSKLIRVLAHELGHALGLEHLDDPKSIMHKMNNGINEIPTQADMQVLRTLCGVK